MGKTLAVLSQPHYRGSSRKLQSRLATLSVPVQDGAASTTLAKSVSGKRYTFPANTAESS